MRLMAEAAQIERTGVEVLQELVVAQHLSV
jgi:hypothetical protein